MTTTPLLAHSREELRDALVDRGPKGPVALVPTMGALHAGHASLLARARDEVGPDAPVVASIFLNPMQFAPGEDLDRYPRSFEADLEMCAEQGVDIVFAPSVEEVYPGGEPQVWVDPGPLGEVVASATASSSSCQILAARIGRRRPSVTTRSRVSRARAT